MNKIILNRDACLGCGSCFFTDEEHFTSDEDGLSKVIKEDVEEISEALNDAISGCPTGAISVVEANGNEVSSCNCDNCPCHCSEPIE